MKLICQFSSCRFRSKGVSIPDSLPFTSTSPRNADSLQIGPARHQHTPCRPLQAVPSPCARLRRRLHVLNPNASRNISLSAEEYLEHCNVRTAALPHSRTRAITAHTAIRDCRSKNGCTRSKAAHVRSGAICRHDSHGDTGDHELQRPFVYNQVDS